MNVLEAAYEGMRRAVEEINARHGKDDAVCSACGVQAADPDCGLCEDCQLDNLHRNDACIDCQSIRVFGIDACQGCSANGNRPF
jgi:hypothetical protein